MAVQVAADSMVQTLTDPSYTPGDQGAPPWLGNLLASVVARTLPKGMEFARYSIDYHYLRNQLYVREKMGLERAEAHVRSPGRGLEVEERPVAAAPRGLSPLSSSFLAFPSPLLSLPSPPAHCTSPPLASSLPSLTLPLFDPLGGKVPKYAQALMKRYDADMEELRKGPSGARSSQGEGGTTGMLAETMKDVKGWGTVLRELLLL